MKIFEWLAELRFRNNPLYQVGMVHFIVAVLLCVGLVIDAREILGINPWIKPIKFFISTGIFLWSIGWYLFDLRLTRMKWVKFLSWTFILAFTIENIIILLQPLRGVRSHFNFDTPLDSLLFGIMGLGVLIITGATIVFFILYLLHKSERKVNLFAIRIGTALSLVGSIIGGRMISAGQHAVGVEDGGPGILFFNWSTEGGDLRIGHFLGLHALQAIPLFAYLLKTKTSLPQNGRYIVTIVFSIAYGGIIAWLYSSAMKGNSLF